MLIRALLALVALASPATAELTDFGSALAAISVLEANNPSVGFGTHADPWGVLCEFPQHAVFDAIRLPAGFGPHADPWGVFCEFGRLDLNRLSSGFGPTADFWGNSAGFGPAFDPWGMSAKLALNQPAL